MSKRPCKCMLQDLTKSGSCLLLKNHGALLAWKTFSFPRIFIGPSLLGFYSGFSLFTLYHYGLFF
ncbi:CPI_1c_G0043230.mRNA.1.CDS.1 [Saccharomyces cerevisiae]|nr:CPI_1c_G0043230.mRNA.1.CDS.1 [Saccharomyces cerevisiae]CAI7434981.1 CPI_1c_G0043230.mRNA.1.CDS.1 [Saccharomyces cerevisiae]